MALGPMYTGDGVQPRPVTPSSVVGSVDRHADLSGGTAPGGVGRFIPRWSADVTLTREQANPNEASVSHERTPYYDFDYMGSHHDSLTNWTDSGPIRQSLHMRQVTINRLQGTSNTRNQDPRPVVTFGTQNQGHGIHTNPPQPKHGTNANFRARQQQQPARINRLAPSVYTGQSYSQTTQVQGS